MLKMERGANTTAGRRNSRVVDMDDLKRARERRASSARHPAEQAREAQQETRRITAREPMRQREERRKPPEPMADDRPFWEQDSPFAEQDKPFWRQERPFRGMEEDDKTPRRLGARQREAVLEPQPVRDRRNTARQIASQERPAESRPAARRGQTHSNAGLKALLVMLALLALTVVIGLKVFEIQEIEVKGAETITPDSVIALSGISKGENIFKTSLTEARRNLESDPLVEVLGISRIFPDKIKIEIRQRKPHAAVAWLSGYAIIDERGFALDVRDTLPAGQYPLITGIDIEPVSKGAPIKGVDAIKLEVMQKLLTALNSKGALQMVSEISLADTNNLIMLTAEGLQVDMGRATDLDIKAQWVAGTVPELRRQGYTSGVLYVTGVKGPVFSSVAPTNSQGDSDTAGEQGENSGKQNNGNEGDGGPDNAA